MFTKAHEDMQFTEQMFDYIFNNLKLNRAILVKDKLGMIKEVNFTTPWPDWLRGMS